MGPINFGISNGVNMGARGFEPLTFSMSLRRANQLRQAPLVRVVGFEPTKPSAYKTDALTAELHALSSCFC